MKKIVLALALAVVTPAVLVAQENGNAYNQNNNEVIAPNTQTQQASIVTYGPEGKILSLADLTLAKIRANRVNREKAEAQEPQAPVQKTEAAPASNKANIDEFTFLVGREGHMMALGNLGQKTSRKPQSSTAPAAATVATPASTPTTPTKSQKTTSTYNPYVGPEGHRMATGNYVRDAREEQEAAPIPTYVHDADTVSNNHQVVLSEKATQKSTKSRNSSFRRNLVALGSAVGHALVQQAPYDK